MAYSCDITRLLTEQLTKFTTLNRHQLAGHVANLDFWLAEVRHCFDVLDGYGPRLKHLKAAHVKHVSLHKTIEVDLDDPCCVKGPVTPPRRVPHTEIQEARRPLCDAMYRFLVRCFHEELIDEAALRRECQGLGVSVEATDVKRRSQDVR